ncbi:class II aldolase/adducin family protein [Bacillus sp. JJ1533]|uniref:class II aldolase/adducin family protein n=1 Tax=Bacillus sp. JJ1533 TaxID=3122959 RepID=UPI002FFF6B7D
MNRPPCLMASRIPDNFYPGIRRPIFSIRKVQEMKEVINELQHTGRYMLERNLAWGNAGNMSARLSEDRCLITASGTSLGELAEDDFAECTFGAEISSFRRKPSKELPMHSAIYEERPDVNAVLHASPFYSTLIACSEIDLSSDLFVETMYYLERVERVPYCHPGSVDLGEAVREKATKANILLLENHGILVYDSSIKEARTALETLEVAAKMVITAKQAGIPLKSLSSDTVHHFLDHSGYKPRRKWN